MHIEHTALYVRDLEAARAFFVRYFGATSNEGYRNPKTGLRTYFLSFEGGARLELMTRPELTDASPEPYPVGLTHIAFSTGSREAVDSLTARLAADGYAVRSGPRVTGDGYYESCVQGPEGCLLELTV
jgi:lactoylglutathione lyase